MARLIVGVCAIVLLLLGFSYVQAQNERAASPCKTAKTCGACMQASPDCRWCSQEDFLYDRCDNGITLESLGCGKSSIINEKSSINFTKDENVNDGIGGKPAVQLSPQEIRLKLRPNEPYKLRVTFRQAENYPVDLYYLMDLSASMNDDRDKLAELGVKIAEEMKNITKNFRLGFGSFVDKRAMPYVSTVPKKLQNPCETLTYIKTCDKPYGFKNQMQLGDDPNYFSERVRGAAVSGNLDSPEGGLDALMQALVCKEKIGWRGYSRKMVLFSTDAPSHFAGDGKLGGIVLPNDGKCHLDTDGLYTHSLLQDYPSISQIARKVSSHNVNVIFAVTSDQTKTYRSLSEFLDGSTVGTLEKDSANIVELVKKNYKDITSKVELKTEGAEDFDVTFQSECLDGKLMDTATCEKLGIGENVTFEVTITAPKCPAGGPQSRQFNIYPVGLSDRLTVKVELVCNCGCENPEVTEGDSDKCNGTGKYECGACNCNENRYGQFCQCDAKTVNTKDYDYSCRKTNTSELCEGRGSCVCGKCDCYPISSKNPARKWDGQFCDCDNYNCPYSHGQPCGGPTRGICECSKCKCIGDYFGSNCRCPKSNKKCLTKDGVECNGKGECRCGECVCNKDPFYRGPTCEDCPTCSGKCELNRPCVECKIFREGTLDEESCRANCTHVTGVAELQELDDRRQCQFFDEKNCKFFFTYEYKTNKVEAQETKECPKPVNILAIVLSIIIGIIVIGLALLLIWKLLITINDRREFAKFEKERMNAKWDTGENPIYKQATSTFKNPTYAGKS